MQCSLIRPVRPFLFHVVVLGSLVLVATAGCSTRYGPGEAVTAEAAAPPPAEAPAAAEPEGVPVTKVSEEPDVYALPGAERLPPVPPAWMTPAPRPAQVFEPPAAYRPPSLPEAQRYFAAEVPTVKGTAFVGAPSGAGDGPADGPPAQGPVARGTVVPGPAAPAPSVDFDSTDFDDNATNTGGFLFIPADPLAAAGPNHVLNVVNVSLRFHQKDGTLVFGDALDDFFAALSPATFTFDPKVLFDQHAGRWVVITLERTDDGPGGSPETSKIFVAVSDDADPTGTWYQAAIDATTTIGATPSWADYPGLAVDEEAIYVTANMFGFAASGFPFTGVRLWILDKGLGTGGFYDGGTLTGGLFDPYAGGGIVTTTQPAHVYGDAPAGVGTWLVAYSGISTGGVSGTEAVQVIRVDDPLGTPTFSIDFVDFGNVEDLIAPLPGAPQSGTSDLVDTNDRRALHAVWYADSLWLTATIDPKAGDPDAGEATAYWWEIGTGSDPPSLEDHGAVLGDDVANDTYTFFSSVAVNGIGQVAIGFSGAAATLFPGSYYTTREPADAAGTTSGSATLRSGTASYTRTFCGSNRWGDYSGIAVDPVDGCFWVYNKHTISQGSTTTIDCDGNGSQETSENGRWSTAFGNVCLPGACPADMVLASIDLSGTQTRKAAVTLRTVEGVTVKTGADVTFRSGTRIVFGDGFSVEGGASFVAQVTGSPCS